MRSLAILLVKISRESAVNVQFPNSDTVQSQATEKHHNSTTTINNRLKASQNPMDQLTKSHICLKFTNANNIKYAKHITNINKQKKGENRSAEVKYQNEIDETMRGGDA